MAEISQKVIFQNRRDTAANWVTQNPTLLAGEIGVETDTLQFKIGDGTTEWTSLRYCVNKIIIGSRVPTSSDNTYLLGTFWLYSNNAYVLTDITTNMANWEKFTNANDLTSHINNNTNPHAVTAAQVGAATSAQGAKADSAIQGIKVNGTAVSPDGSKVVNIDISGKADKVATPVANNFAGLNASGNIIDSGKKASDFDNAGAANTVQQNLNTHTGRTNNPHSVTASQIGAATSTQGGKADSAIQSVKVNGTALTPDANKTVNIDISGKADKIPTPTNGNLAGMDANGNITNSGKKASDFESAGAAATVQQNLNSHTGNTSNPHSVTASQVGAATSGQGAKADSAIQGVKVNGSALTPDASKIVNVDISGKIDKVTSATNGNFAKFNASGSVEDSGKKATDFENSGAAVTVQQNLNSHTGNTSNPHNVTASQVGAATSAQGTKADSAIQSIKIAGVALTPDASKAVDILAVIPSGGSTSQVLAKVSGNNYDTHWVDMAGGGGTGSVQSVNGVDPDGNGDVVISATDIGAATSAQGTKADSAIQGVKVNNTTLTPDSSKVVNVDISGKADKIASPTSGNFAGMDANGNLTNSGKKSTDFATAAQGTKADSAIQSVKVNGTALTPDSNKVVDITAAQVGVEPDIQIIRVAAESSLPTTSLSNTIAVISSTAFSNVYINDTPTSPTAGDVVISTELDEDFNMKLYPVMTILDCALTAKQYINSSWTSVTLKIRYNNQWN